METKPNSPTQTSTATANFILFSSHSSSIMDSRKLCFSLLILFLLSLLSVHGAVTHRHRHGHLFKYRPSRLFVFGDSFVDTGNSRETLSRSWRPPYGVTFPGIPAGRYSDGRVLTDYFAKFLGVKSPIPYRWRTLAGKRLKHGVNFAYGGTGVFDTWISDPNMTTQIDLFQQLIKGSAVTVEDLKSSVALVSLNGNDYTYYIARDGSASAEGIKSFMVSVVNQLAVNLERILAIGVKKIVVTKLAPLGCFPANAGISSFRQCNERQNTFVNFHNSLLEQAVSHFNNTTNDSAFVISDLYSSFMSVIQNTTHPLGKGKFENPLKPCCVGISRGYSCGDVDENGKKKYSVCENPKLALFWDDLHPTHEGWRALFSALQTRL